MTRVIKAAHIFVAVLQEIFDESAYARFLERARMRTSAAAYAAFWREREAARNRSPKCC